MPCTAAPAPGCEASPIREVLGPANDLSTADLFRCVIDNLSSAEPRLAAPLALHRRPTRQVVDGCLALCASDDPYERRVGLQVLRELRHPEVDDEKLWSAVEPMVLDLAGHERDPDVRYWAISCLGYQSEVGRALDVVLDQATHEHWRVRFGVAAALPHLIDRASPDARAVAVLETLANDPDADVRSYAIMGLVGDLGRLDEIRPLLDAGTADPDEQIRDYCRRALNGEEA